MPGHAARARGGGPRIHAHERVRRVALGSAVCFGLAGDVHALKGAVGAASAAVVLAVAAALPAADAAADHAFAVAAVAVVAFCCVGGYVEELDDADCWGSAWDGGGGALGPG